MSLKEILNVPTDLEPFISDYKINVFELAWLTDKQIQSFTSDFRYVAILLRRLRTRRPYPLSTNNYKHAREIIDLFTVMSQNNREVELILEEINNEKASSGGTRMTEKEVDDMINRFEDRGAQKKAIEAAKAFLADGKYTAEEISVLLKIPVESFTSK